MFVICRDRVLALRRLLTWLEDEGLTNVVLVDNASTYPPLLDLYRETPHRVIRLAQNWGHNSVWETGLVDTLALDRPYVVTDPDVVPDTTAHGALSHFARLLNSFPHHVKVGFGLRIDDLPSHFERRDDVLAWEASAWENEVCPDVFQAPIDTTFALYRASVRAPTLGPSLRTGGRFVARHEPWYEDSRRPSEELRHYRAHARPDVTNWTKGTGEP